MQTVLDVSNEVAAELAGIGDPVLDALRHRLGCTVNLRGNRLTLAGDDLKVADATALLLKPVFTPIALSVLAPAPESRIPSPPG